MTTIVATGFAIVLLASLLQGLFALAMKFAHGWNYENIWLIFATTGLVILPWMLTAAAVPHLPSGYRAVAMQEEDRSGRGSFLAGLRVAAAPEPVSSSLNFCYAFGRAAMDQARLLSLGNDADYLRAGGSCPGNAK